MFLLHLILIINVLLVNQFPEIYSYYLDEPKTKKTPTTKLLRRKTNFSIRQIACRGTRGELAKVTCCSDNLPKPWLMFLPTEHKSKCYISNCRDVCYSAIVNLRKSRLASSQAPKRSINYCQTKKQILCDGNNEIAKSLCNGDYIQSPNIVIPEVILELLDLCSYLKDSLPGQCEGLRSLCKTRNMTLDNFLKHISYSNEQECTTPLCIDVTDEQESSECNKSDSKCYYQSDITDPKVNEQNVLNNVLNTNGANKDTNVTKPNKKICFNMMNNNPPFAIQNQRILPEILLRTCKIPQSFNTPVYSDQFKSSTFRNTELVQNMGNTESSTTQSCSGLNISTMLKNVFQLLFRGPSLQIKTDFGKIAKSKNKIESNNRTNEKLEEQIQRNVIYNNPIAHANLNLETPEKALEKQLQLEAYQPGEPVEHYIAYISDQCSDMYKRYKRAQWDYETNISSYTQQKAKLASLQFTHLLTAVNKELKSLIAEPIKNYTLERQLKLLFLPGMCSLPELKQNEFDQILYAMETIYSSAVINKWNHNTDKVSLNPMIINIMASSQNPKELKYYWTEWRKVTGKQIRALFEEYVSLMKLAAKSNGFNDASEMWMRQYETEDFLDTFSSHWEEVKPLYTHLHAYIRHKLHGIYGDLAGARDTGEIPAHLTGDMWSQNWKNIYNKVVPYKIKDDYMNLELNIKKFTPKYLAKKTEEMFLSLGFSGLPNEFWKNSILSKSDNTIMSCTPSSWDMGNGMDFRIKLCATSNMQSLLEIHKQMTKTEYYKEYAPLPYAFRTTANPGFLEAISGTVVLSSHTRAHLNFFGLRKSVSEKATINQLMRLALEKVVFIPYSYILILWRNKVFSGEINSTEYNSKWWELRSQYQGISPPFVRSEEDFDIGAEEHIATNQPYMKYFVSTILQFQFYEALCKKANYHGQLHECDITGSLEAGKALRKVMSMGSFYHWKVALQELTGSRKMDSRPLRQYFEPLYLWLKTKNKEENVKVGWEY